MFVARIHENATLPVRGTKFAAGYDLTTVDNCVITPRARVCLRTGLKISIPAGYYGRIASRSGLSFKNGLEVGAGTIDEDYRGEVKVILFNLSDEPFEVKSGMRIAQMIIEKYHAPVIVEIADVELDKTARGEDGFGSTGIFTSEKQNITNVEQKHKLEQYLGTTHYGC